MLIGQVPLRPLCERLRSCVCGAAAVEYGVLLAGLAAVIIVSVQALQVAANAAYAREADSLAAESEDHAPVHGDGGGAEGSNPDEDAEETHTEEESGEASEESDDPEGDADEPTPESDEVAPEPTDNVMQTPEPAEQIGSEWRASLTVTAPNAVEGTEIRVRWTGVGDDPVETICVIDSSGSCTSESPAVGRTGDGTVCTVSAMIVSIGVTTVSEMGEESFQNPNPPGNRC